MKKRILPVLLALVLGLGVIAVAPVVAHAAGPDGPSPTDIWNFTTADADGSGSYGGGSWSWVQDTKTLTLTNISHSTPTDLALYLPGSSTIVLNGTNVIASTQTSDSSTAGISATNLTITGSALPPHRPPPGGSGC